MPLVVVDQEGEINEGDSQQSNKDSAASFMDSDIEDDTMVSQQTAATEMTIPLQSAASLVILFDARPELQTDSAA